MTKQLFGQAIEWVEKYPRETQSLLSPTASTTGINKLLFTCPSKLSETTHCVQRKL